MSQDKVYSTSTKENANGSRKSVQRHGVRIYQPFNIETNAQETNIFQRLIWQEHINPIFVAAQGNFAFVLADHAQYIKAIA